MPYLLSLFIHLLFVINAPVEPIQQEVLTTETISFRENTFDIYRVNLAEDDLCFYWQGEDGKPLKSIGALKRHINAIGDSLLFATNGGMYLKNRSPQGLYIENGVKLRPMDTGKKAKTNFYMKPNGVFLITEDNEAKVVTTEKYPEKEAVKFATQSGPMLLIDGKIHPTFREGSQSKYVRSGVGIVNEQEIVFVITNEVINFYDFALFYKEVLGCKNALYLDGAISRMYIKESQRLDLGGGFGCMIAVTKSL